MFQAKWMQRRGRRWRNSLQPVTVDQRPGLHDAAQFPLSDGRRSCCGVPQPRRNRSFVANSVPNPGHGRWTQSARQCPPPLAQTLPGNYSFNSTANEYVIESHKEFLAFFLYHFQLITINWYINYQSCIIFELYSIRSNSLIDEDDWILMLFIGWWIRTVSSSQTQQYCHMMH